MKRRPRLMSESFRVIRKRRKTRQKRRDENAVPDCGRSGIETELRSKEKAPARQLPHGRLAIFADNLCFERWRRFPFFVIAFAKAMQYFKRRGDRWSPAGIAPFPDCVGQTPAGYGNSSFRQATGDRLHELRGYAGFLISGTFLLRFYFNIYR